jgi:ribosomal protein S12 methylthiotransferase
VLQVMADNPKICPYIDIPLQHSADRVLAMMRRGVDGRQTRELVARMRQMVPGVVLRTTLIVGHPGEGEAEFDDLLDFVRECRFERLGAFTYSEEEGTYGALHYKDEIPQEVKQERYDLLMELQSGISLAYNESRIGTRERVIVDGYSDGILVCRSQTESPEVDGEILVDPGIRTGERRPGGALSVPRGECSTATRVLNAPQGSPSELIGQFIDVDINGANEYDLIADIV